MQVFVPYPEFSRCAQVLDDKRLGKQRVETLQIMNALLKPYYGWQNHPAVNMWRGYETSLMDYQSFICNEWTRVRGFQDTCLRKTSDLYESYFQDDWSFDDPWWLRDPEIHRSHQSNLIRKDPFWYGPRFPGVPDDLPYIWPVSNQ